ncbi:hypothetical protein [Sandaracinobacteroides saxicola]|uniref:Uncharacterized protein n=1 Tax=Sandaracinobacteroides saxicola TaxID=2759707 RepID=A0A7G5IHJ7_9SPHN|nr:hypothetical protein [Sandaracinobacteroides saxicola]QMW22839.1 hypothetical protein H3309_16330 [Sandaracinobacteroides saxicola]
MAGGATGGVTAGTGEGGAPSGTIATTVADPAALKAVADSVKDIVNESNTVDDFLMLCINMLSRAPEPGVHDLRASCLTLVTSAANLNAAKLDQQVEKLTARRQDIINTAPAAGKNLSQMSFDKIEPQLRAARESIGLPREDSVWQALLAGIKANDATAVEAAMKRLNNTSLVTKLNAIKE